VTAKHLDDPDIYTGKYDIYDRGASAPYSPLFYFLSNKLFGTRPLPHPYLKFINLFNLLIKK